MRIYEMPYRGDGETYYPENRRRRSDGTYMVYERPYPRMEYPSRYSRYPEDMRRYHESERRYNEERRYPGYVPPSDHYGNDDEFYEGDFRIIRGRDY